MKIVFLKWFPYDKRNEAISSSLNAKCFFIYSQIKRTVWNAPFRYFLQFFKTIKLLYNEKPDIIFVTNPPIFAPLTVYLYCFIFKEPQYIVDSHSGSFSKRWSTFEQLHRFLSRNAKLTIVTNHNFENIYRGWGAKTFILSDLVFEIKKSRDVELSKQFNISCICSFDPDEPIEEILSVAQEMPEVSFYITGNYKRYCMNISEGKTSNIHFTGFLNDQDYFDLLYACDAVMVLVKEENTMQQGAYEAVSIKKPMILSNTNVLRTTYKFGTVFVDNNVDSIKKGILQMKNNHDEYILESEDNYQDRKEVWERKCLQLKYYIYNK